MSIKIRLDMEVAKRNSLNELSYSKPDPLIIATRYQDEYIALASALFAYGKASMIVKFLDSIDFNILTQSDKEIKKYFSSYCYRFQNADDITRFFVALKRIQEIDSLNTIFIKGYKKEHNILNGIGSIVEVFHTVDDFDSHGLKFLLGKVPNIAKPKAQSPYKRWNMYLRWMIRKDFLDLGLWSKVEKKDLIIPLDTHTFHVSLKLGLLNRKTYDLYSALLITDKLKEFDKDDPIKYDFALYRLGQEQIV